MAGGGMGVMPQGLGQQGGIGGMPVGPGLSGGLPQGINPDPQGIMSGAPVQGPGMGMIGAGMGGMGFGGGMPQMPQGDTFMPQQGAPVRGGWFGSGSPQPNLDQISSLLRGLQGSQGFPQIQQAAQQVPQAVQQQQMQQPMTRSAERAWYDPQQQLAQPAPAPSAPLPVQAQQQAQQPRRGLFGRPFQETRPAPQAGIASLPQADRSQSIANAMSGYNKLMAGRRR